MKFTDKHFSLFRRECFSTITWHDLFLNRRILICSVTRAPQSFLSLYIKDLEIYSEMYKLLGVDETYLIAPAGLGFLTIANRTQTLSCLGDVNREFVEHLDGVVNDKKRDKLFLSRFWNFQVLIDNGIVEHIAQQPLENYLATYLKDTKDIDTIKNLKITKDDLVWTPTYLSRSHRYAKKLYYYKLHPNLSLKEHLFQTRLTTKGK